MKNEVIRFEVREPNFGASTAVEVTIDKNKTVLFVSDKSTYKTNWTWDYVPESFSRCIGNSIDSFFDAIKKHNHNLTKGEEYRKPHWIQL